MMRRVPSGRTASPTAQPVAMPDRTAADFKASVRPGPRMAAAKARHVPGPEIIPDRARAVFANPTGRASKGGKMVTASPMVPGRRTGHAPRATPADSAASGRIPGRHGSRSMRPGPRTEKSVRFGHAGLMAVVAFASPTMRAMRVKAAATGRPIVPGPRGRPAVFANRMVIVPAAAIIASRMDNIPRAAVSAIPMVRPGMKIRRRRGTASGRPMVPADPMAPGGARAKVVSANRTAPGPRAMAADFASRSDRASLMATAVSKNLSAPAVKGATAFVRANRTAMVSGRPGRSAGRKANRRPARTAAALKPIDLPGKDL